MSDHERLAGYVDVWWQAVTDFTDLLAEVPDDQWSTPTDCPGWDVRAVASHVAHLEAVLAGAPEETADIGEPAHVTGLTGMYTEIGVVNRRETSPAEIVEEIRRATTARHDALLADPPTDAAATAPVTPGGLPWTWERLLRNRPLDVWMHEQDVRRAVGRPGGLDSAPARHTADYLRESFGVVLAKKAGAPAGTTALLQVEGSTRSRSASTTPAAARASTRCRPIRRSRWRWTARPTSCWPAGDGRPPRARSSSAATRTSPGGSSERWPPRRDGAVDAWALADIPDQAGRTALVTGTTVGGLGHHTALELARRGARVVLAGRSA